MPACAGQSLDVETLLRRHRHPEQGRGFVHLRIERAGSATGSVEIADHDGIDAGIVLLHPGDVVVQQFQGTDFPGSNEIRQLRRTSRQQPSSNERY
jgi:hypothetical protein